MHDCRQVDFARQRAPLLIVDIVMGIPGTGCSTPVLPITPPSALLAIWELSSLSQKASACAADQ
jgi:hypothetical protein